MKLVATPYLFSPTVIRKAVKPNKSGVYILGDENGGFHYGYVGRSDYCLRNRLLTHNHLYKFDYFIFDYTPTSKQAFWKECEWWHNCLENEIANLIHPASPQGSGLECPYCHFAFHFQKNQAL